MWEEWKICILGHPQAPVGPLLPRRSRGAYTQFWNHMVRDSSHLQSRSKAVVCVSTPRMYPCSGYFLVNTIRNANPFPLNYNGKFSNISRCKTVSAYVGTYINVLLWSIFKPERQFQYLSRKGCVSTFNLKIALADLNYVNCKCSHLYYIYTYIY